MTGPAVHVHSEPVETGSQLESAKSQSLVFTWLRRLATVGFLFFLVKGLVWLAVALSVVFVSL